MKKIMKTKVRKKYLFWGKVILVFIILGFVFHGSFVRAGSMDSKLKKNRVDGVYAFSRYNGEKHLFYLNMYTLNDVISYCIEMGKDITTEVYNSTEDFGLAYLSKADKEYIQSIAYFGYSYPGHGQKFYYMAAQELIWEYLSGGEVEWVSSLDKTGERINIDSYKKEILDLRNYYYQGLQLNFVNGNTYSIGDFFPIEVMTGDLDLYDIVDSGHCKVSKNGKFLQLEIGNDYVGRERILLKRKGIYGMNSKLYYYDTSQQLISAGNFIDDTIEISFQVVGKDMNFLVIDGETKENKPTGQASFEGATYQLFTENNEFIEEFSVNEFGKGYVNNLPYGNYIVRQVKESLGYQLNTNDVFVSFGVDEMPVLLEEYPYYQTIRIFKQYNFENTGEYRGESGIQFEVLNYLGEKYLDVVTDNLGYAEFRVPYGHYKVRQVNTLYGYAKVSNFGFGVYNPSNGVSVINLFDQYILCKIKLNEIEVDSNEKILSDDFSYKIFNVDKNQYLTFEGNDTFKTNSNGELIFPMEIGYGNYLIEEIGVENNYIFQNQKIPIVINDDVEMELVDDYFVYSFNVYQKLLQGEVDIFTRQETSEFSSDLGKYFYDEIPRVNKIVEVISQDDIYLSGTLIYKKGEVIEKISTDSNGDGKILLYLGHYCFRDTELDETSCISIENKGDLLHQKIKFLKKIPRLNIFYYNKDNNGNNIEGTTVDVFDEEKKNIYQMVTNKEGFFSILDVPPGRYCFVQRKVSDQYLLMKEERCIEINDTKVNWDIFVNNQISKQIIWVPDTFDKSISYLKIILFMGIGVIGFVFFFKKIFNHFH